MVDAHYLLTTTDVQRIGEGRHERLWEVMGAQVTTVAGTLGTSFTVWAPNARMVHVAGDFNGWDGRRHPMTLIDGGLWTTFVPGIGDGAVYKFTVHGADGIWRDKADPMAFRTEVPPAQASVVHRTSYVWGDDAWLKRRSGYAAHDQPVSVYEIHLGSWRRGGTYRELAPMLADYVTQLGFTHVELLPLTEHPYSGSWGYQVTAYYAPTARFGSPDDFKYLVDTLHQAGIGVILDWVPAHFPKDDWALARFDGTPLYEHPDPRRGEHPDWGTYVFDFGRPEVRNFLVANAVFWLTEYHLDGLRVDAVASMLYLDYSRGDGAWLPNVHGGRENLEAIAFLQETNAAVYGRVPGIVTAAEESTAWPGVTTPIHHGGLGFGLKWNMGWMHDSLAYLAHDPIYRQYHHHQMTFSITYAFSENFILPLSHDEVVHGKGSLLAKLPGDDGQRLATLRAYFAVMWAHPGKKLLFMGGEFGQTTEWSDAEQLDWDLLRQSGHGGLHHLVGDLNREYLRSPELWRTDADPTGFDWIDSDDASGNVFSFLRYGPDRTVLACVANFAAIPHEDYRLGLPIIGQWKEVINTDASAYGGSGADNRGRVSAGDQAWHNRPASTLLHLPALSALWLRPA
jgi:1,4-alpha-glucan branching enzyme